MTHTIAILGVIAGIVWIIIGAFQSMGRGQNLSRSSGVYEAIGGAVILIISIAVLTGDLP